MVIICQYMYVNFLTYTIFVDVNECSDQTHDCSQLCNNSIGNFTCYCTEGYNLDIDGKTCNGKLLYLEINYIYELTFFFHVNFFLFSCFLTVKRVLQYNVFIRRHSDYFYYYTTSVLSKNQLKSKEL